MKGMSGYPILRFARDGDGVRYYFVAIQSGWLPDSKVTYACLMPYHAKLLADAIDEALRDLESSAE
jgi:hypothetical protein